MKVWVLTEEYNDYDQHGEYFIEVFRSIPTRHQLLNCYVPESSINHVLNGGGRIEDEYQWFLLSEHSI